jgi:hypothetical protein
LFFQKTSAHRSNSLSNRPIDVSHIKPTINTWNDQYQQTKNTVEVKEFLLIIFIFLIFFIHFQILHQPIHVEAHSKLNTFQSQPLLPKKRQVIRVRNRFHSKTLINFLFF